MLLGHSKGSKAFHVQKHTGVKEDGMFDLEEYLVLEKLRVCVLGSDKPLNFFFFFFLSKGIVQFVIW